MPRVLLLIPTTSYRASDFLAAAENEGVEVVVGSNKRQTLEDVVPNRTLTLDFAFPREAAQRVIAFSQTHPLDAVVPTDEEAVLLASLILKALHLPHNPFNAVVATQDKYRLRTVLTHAGIPTPQASCFSITHKPEEIAQKMTYPVVLKPIHLSASRGVIRADDATQFIKSFKRIVKILKDPEVVTRNPEAAQKILVESFIPGVEVALEGMLQNGLLSTLAIFDKPDPLNGPFFEETIYVTPSRLSDATCQAIMKTTQEACKAIGLQEGPVHAELRIHPNGVFIIEVAARSIGGLCSRTLTFGLGISLEQLILQHALGRPIQSSKRESKASGVMMIPIPMAGRLVHVHGVDDAKDVPGICGVEIAIRPTQEVVPLPEGRRYMGFIFARGETPDGVEQALRRAEKKISFDMADIRLTSNRDERGEEAAPLLNSKTSP